MEVEAEQTRLLTTLYDFQQEGYLCDATLASTDGTECVAHAGVLAAASLSLTKELEQCERGQYYILTSYSGQEIANFIHYCYTSEKKFPIPNELIDIETMITGNLDHRGHRYSLLPQLAEFQDRNLFCDTAVYTTNDEIHAAQSYMLAAKYIFMSPNINGSFVTVTSPHIISLQVYNSEKKVSGKTVYVSDVCNRQFTKLGNLRRHRRIHHGLRPYVCNVCDKGFLVNSQLKAHLAIHTNKGQHLCRVCSKDFPSSSQLRTHQCNQATKQNSRYTDLQEQSQTLKQQTSRYTDLHEQSYVEPVNRKKRSHVQLIHSERRSHGQSVDRDRQSPVQLVHTYKRSGTQPVNSYKRSHAQPIEPDFYKSYPVCGACNRGFLKMEQLEIHRHSCTGN